MIIIRSYRPGGYRYVPELKTVMPEEVAAHADMADNGAVAAQCSAAFPQRRNGKPYRYSRYRPAGAWRRWQRSLLLDGRWHVCAWRLPGLPDCVVDRQFCWVIVMLRLKSTRLPPRPDDQQVSSTPAAILCCAFRRRRKPRIIRYGRRGL